MAKPTVGNMEFESLIKHVNADDPLQIVIRCHLIVESKLIKLIELSLENKNELDVEKLNFPTKVNLAFALGCIEEKYLKPVLLNINSLRNKFAHNIKYELSENDVMKLYNKNPSLELVLEKGFKERSLLDRLRAAIAMTFIELDVTEKAIEEIST
ncbi:hypothetical protein [Lederbergia citrea]|uniref:Uncharacterized protein n=1 Tax=Lederbergia citrea TaxID=2833581 RepID=A0A942UH69_9BACI|nr:hypothetical protein [Lederbergia citrea]MBS4204024.1 hypothetical protein [Lederbergia citrea]MBS4221391.1 hypothetical protein [Lederbergia citrea]